MPRRPATGFAPGTLRYHPAVALLTLAAVGGGIAYTERQQKKGRKKAESAAEAARQEIERTAATERAEEQQKKAARAELLAKPTAGFGPNPNTARSFLTSL